MTISISFEIHNRAMCGIIEKLLSFQYRCIKQFLGESSVLSSTIRLEGGAGYWPGLCEERRTTSATWKLERSKGTGSDTLRVKILGHVYRVNFLRTEILYGLSYFGVAEEEYGKIPLLPYILL